MSKRKKNVNGPSDGDPIGGYVEVGRDHLIERLGLLKTVLVRRATRKDLATVHVEVMPGGNATVAATDMENALRLKLEVLHATGAGRVMIDAHALDAMLGAYHEPRVRVHLDDPVKVRVEGVQTKLQLPGSDPDKEMKLTAPGSLTTAGWVVRADVLESAIRRTKFAVDLDGGTRYALGGLALHFPKDGGGPLEVVGCDGRRLSVVRVPVRAHGECPPRTTKAVRKGAPPNEGVPIVVNKALNALLRIARAAGDTSLGLAVIPGDPIDLEKDPRNPARIQAVTRDAVLTALCPDGRYPNWRDVLPSGQVVAGFTLDDATTLGALLATAAAACDAERKGVEITMAGGSVLIESGSDTRGKSQASLTGVEMTGRGAVTVDGLMLRQFFDAIGGERLRVKFHGPNSPLVFHAGPDHDFILMPLTRDDPRPKAPDPAPPTAGPDGDRPADEGDGGPTPEPATPEPHVPVGATPDAHRGNGKAKA